MMWLLFEFYLSTDIDNITLIFSPEFATVGQSKERAFEQKEKVHKHFPLSR